jgi:uncharacterized peroxidase-related enzyme
MFITRPPASEDTERIYRSSLDAQGFTMNLTHAWGWRPDVFEGFAALRGQLTSKSTLTKREQAVIVCSVAAQLGDSYCCLAWGKTLTLEAGVESAVAVIAGKHADSLSSRDQALAAWARKVVASPNRTTATDVQSLRAVGFTDCEIFEATAFIGFRLAFSTVNDALGVHPDWQLVDAVHPAVRDAIDFGRPAEAQPT